MRKLSALPLIALLLFLLALPAVGNEGECPEGYAKISTGFDGLSWTADADYETVILVGGPPNENNDDPDGRDKVFTDVEEGDVISRVAHDISHICTNGTPTTTTAPTTTEETTTTTEATTTTSETTTTQQSTTTQATVLPGVVTATTSPTLPFTGIDSGALGLLAAALSGVGVLTVRASRG